MWTILSALELLNAVTASKIPYNEKERRIDMCKAIDGMMQDVRAEGRAEGKAEGALEMLAKLVENGLLSLAQAAEQANMSVADFKKFTGISA